MWEEWLECSRPEVFLEAMLSFRLGFLMLL